MADDIVTFYYHSLDYDLVHHLFLSYDSSAFLVSKIKHPQVSLAPLLKLLLLFSFSFFFGGGDLFCCFNSFSSFPRNFLCLCFLAVVASLTIKTFYS